MMSEQQSGGASASQQESPLKACCDLEYLLIGDLRNLLGQKTGRDSQSSLTVLLDRLIQNLPNVLELSSEDGYLNSVIERRPNLSPQVNALYQANLDCISSLKSVRRCLEDDQSISETSKELEVRLKNWVDSFSSMRCEEVNMLQEAFSIDLGGEA